MKTDPHTLRFRLFVLILTPLLIVSLFLGYWRFSVAQQTANELFDRGLLSTALAISRDVASSEGDALSPSTRDLLTDASGGEVFYHATGPGDITSPDMRIHPSNQQRSALNLKRRPILKPYTVMSRSVS